MEIFKNATFIRNMIVSFIIVLTGSAAFGLGRFSVLMAEKEPITIENNSLLVSTATASSATGRGISESIGEESAPSNQSAPTLPSPIVSPWPNSASASSSETFVASKTGTAYYFPWCGIVKRIKPENLVAFNSREEAEKAGLKPGNCAGLK